MGYDGTHLSVHLRELDLLLSGHIANIRHHVLLPHALVKRSPTIYISVHYNHRCTITCVRFPWYLSVSPTSSLTWCWVVI
jgi:hypothetical protein